MVMDFSKLRHRVTIQEYIPTRDSFGAEVEVWTGIATVWASVEPLSGKEYFAAQQINSEITAKITMRHLNNINPKMRAVFDSRIFEILSIVNLEERNISLVLMVKEVV